MAWRCLHLSRPARLSLESKNLKIDFRDGEVFRAPLEDLACVVIDSRDADLSAPLMSRLAGNATLVLGVDEKHMPSWMAMPIAGHHRQGPVIELQLGASAVFRKRLWSEIVGSKISMQAACLRTLGRISEADSLQKMARTIRSGDSTNVEARAARAYWAALFHDRRFARHDEDLPNAMLNYGYAIIRSAIARSLCASGFIPQIGIHHRNSSNAFNLADDLIEPYRPFVDSLVVRTLGNIPSETPFETNHRRAIATILELKMLIGAEVFGFLPAVDKTVLSLIDSLRTRHAPQIVFPRFSTDEG
jgi:CRISPR-associated protein Cas1